MCALFSLEVLQAVAVKGVNEGNNLSGRCAHEGKTGSDESALHKHWPEKSKNGPSPCHSQELKPSIDVYIYIYIYTVVKLRPYPWKWSKNYSHSNLSIKISFYGLVKASLTWTRFLEHSNMIFRSFVLDCSLSALSVYAATSSLHEFQKMRSILKILNKNGGRDSSAGTTERLT